MAKIITKNYDPMRSFYKKSNYLSRHDPNPIGGFRNPDERPASSERRKEKLEAEYKERLKEYGYDYEYIDRPGWDE